MSIGEMAVLAVWTVVLCSLVLILCGRWIFPTNIAARVRVHLRHREREFGLQAKGERKSSAEHQGLDQGKVLDPDKPLSTKQEATSASQDVPVLQPHTALRPSVSAQHTSVEPRPLSVDVSIGGRNNPTFLSPTSGNTFNFYQTAILQGTSGERSTPSLPVQMVHPSEVAAEQCQQAMKTRYTTTGSYVQIIPWVDDDSKHIMSIYTHAKLQFEKDENALGVQGNVKQKLKSYEDVFLIKTREGHVINRIILSGLAGLGKTTLIDKIAYDWAIAACNVLRMFKLVFVLKLHAVQSTSTLIDAIFQQLLDADTCINRSDLKSYIDNNPSKVLILLDGFDEFLTSTLSGISCSSILSILSRKESRMCFVLVTTRPSHLRQLVSKRAIQKPFTHVSVKGFSVGNIQQYVNKFYTDDPDKGEGLLQRITSSDVLSDLAKSPMLLLFMCILWRETNSLPDTMSRMYSEALRFIFRRKTNLSQDEILEALSTVGKIALHGLVSPVKMHNSFQEREFGERVLNWAKQAGLLTTKTVLKGLDTQDTVHFTHDSFLEFCAAEYCQSLLKTDPEEFQKILDQIDGHIQNNPSKFEHLLRFCCGDNEASTSKIVQMFQNKSLSDSVLKAALNCYFESQTEKLLSVDFMKSVITDEICISDFSSDSLNSLMWFLKHAACHAKTDENYLAKVSKVRIRRCNVHMISTELTHSMSGMVNLSVLDMRDCSLNDSSVRHIASSLGSAPNLKELDLSINKALGGSGALWAPNLKKMKHLQKLNLSECSLTGQDFEHMAESLGHMSELTELNLSYNQLTGLSPLRNMVHLTKLKLENCCLSMKDFEYVALSVGCMSKLVDCSADIGRDGKLRVEPISDGVRVELSWCSLTASELVDILKALGERADLVELLLSTNDGLSGTADQWSPDLKQLSGTAVSWSPYLRQLKHLQRLALSCCSLQSTDIGHIAASMSDMPTVIELDLSGNKALGGSSTSWAPHLQQIQSLQKLRLRECSLSGDDVKNTVVSLGHSYTLKELDLSWNRALGGSAESWAHWLQELTHLQRLHMSFCSLTDKDKMEIAESHRSMTNVVEMMC